MTNLCFSGFTDPKFLVFHLLKYILLYIKLPKMQFLFSVFLFLLCKFSLLNLVYFSTFDTYLVCCSSAAFYRQGTDEAMHDLYIFGTMKSLRWLWDLNVWTKGYAAQYFLQAKTEQNLIHAIFLLIWCYCYFVMENYISNMPYSIS